jgi:hypothetical protein
MCSRQSSDAVQSSIPHLTIVNVPIKWWLDLPFKAGVPPFYGNFFFFFNFLTLYNVLQTQAKGLVPSAVLPTGCVRFILLIILR